jgi:hypothetical protein
VSLFGKHTVDELQDLLTARDHANDEVAKARAAHPNVAAIDPTWDRDWGAFMARYKPAQRAAVIKVSENAFGLTPNSLIVAETEYQGILDALSKVHTVDGAAHISPGDFSDLQMRLSKMGVPVQYTMPQPKALDVDLLKYNIAETSVKAVQAGGGQFREAVKAGLGAIPEAARDAGHGLGLGDVLKNVSWGKVAFYGVLGLGGVILVTKVASSVAGGVTALPAHLAARAFGPHPGTEE